MILKQKLIMPLIALFETKGRLIFSIETQYKILKIKKLLLTESEIYDQQIKYLNNYFEKDSSGQNIMIDGGIKIKNEFIEECKKKIYEIDNLEIQLPDIYFSLDELEPLNLTLEELELLEPFIKI